MLRKFLSMLLIASMTLFGFAFAEEAAPTHTPLVILYTNDVHCNIDGNIGYAGLAAYKNAYEKAGFVTELVDCGDAVQGAAIGTISNGEYMIDILNEIGYDVAAVGNHEFTYGMDQFFALKDKANFDYVCCNFTDLEGNPILTPYVLRELGGWKIAFVGVDTPETFVKSSRQHFQDENGNYIYSFHGEDLFDRVQASVDAARAEGADMVIALSHLGISFIAENKPWTSSDLIVNTTGIDVVLDGHSHSVVPCETVLNKEGKKVLLSSTGTQLQYVGSLTVTEGEAGQPVFAAKLHDESLFKDDAFAEYLNGIKAQYEEQLQQVVAHTDVDLVIEDPSIINESGYPLWIIRTQETNLGDLCADAYRTITGADIALVNGGGIRTAIPAGDITYEQIISVHPFGNQICVAEVTGQQVLDCLECAVSKLPAEHGGFMHVSGLTFEINMAVSSPVVLDSNGEFVSVEGTRRVQNVRVDGQPIDPDKTYSLASHANLLKSFGDGMTMFKGVSFLEDEVMLDSQLLIRYLSNTLGGVVGEEYADPNGQGRIVILQG